MATMPNGMTTGGGDVQEPDEDSELLCEVFAVMEKYDVDEGLRETIIDMLMRWEMER